jgi:phosphoribosylglycinamide formyltransferase-1
LPAFPGRHTHQRAIDAGCKLAGAPVHFVTAELDHGPIVLPSVVPLLPGDDADTLAERVRATEHRIYPLALRWFVEGQLRCEQGVVRHAGGEPQLLSRL